MLEVSAVDDVDLVSIGVAQIRTEVTVAVVWARAWGAFVRPAVRETLRVGRPHGLLRGGQKGGHAAIAGRRQLAIEGDVDIEARQWRLNSHPAKRRRPAIGGNDAAFQAERSEHGVIETTRPLKIARPDGNMTEHLALHAPVIADRRLLQVCISFSVVIAYVTLAVYLNSVM